MVTALHYFHKEAENTFECTAWNVVGVFVDKVQYELYHMHLELSAYPLALLRAVAYCELPLNIFVLDYTALNAG